MDAADRLRHLAQQHFDAGYEAMPVQATNLGIHKYDDTLGDYSADKVAHNLKRLKDHISLTTAIPPEELKLSNAIDFALLQSDMELGVMWYETLADWKRNPNFYAELPVNGVFLLAAREFAPLEQRLRSIIERLNDTPRLLRQAASNIENPPRVFTEVAIETTEGGISFFEHLIPELAKAVPDLQQDVLSANAKAISACKDFLDFLRNELLRRSNGDFAIGKEAFEKKLRVEHMLDMSTEELRALGERTFAEIERSMQDLAKDIDPHKEWYELVETARREHPVGEELLDAYRNEVSRLRSFIVDNDVLTIPHNERLEIIDTPLFARSTLPYAAYMPPAPFEAEQKGQLWVTPLDTGKSEQEQRAQLEEHSYYAFPTIALHETYPGHHVQLVYSNNVSSYVRKHISNNLMCEGWALYCEHLMSELGYVPAYIASSPDKTKKLKLFRLFTLKDALWRAARIIVDAGLHTGKVSFDEAVEMLARRVRLSERAARAEVKRYTMSPTQPMSYMVGRLKIMAIRESMKHLPLRQFHDHLLSSGTIPPSLIEKEIRAKVFQG